MGIVYELWLYYMLFILTGIIFYKSANEGERMFDHLKFCIGAILTIVYTQVMVPILSCKLSINESREKKTM